MLDQSRSKKIWKVSTRSGRNNYKNKHHIFIHKHEIPQDRLKDVTYIKFIASIRTEKDDPYRIRATLGGNLIHYPDDVETPSANLLLIKILLNSVISTKGAKFAMPDLSNFYLMTELK